MKKLIILFSMFVVSCASTMVQNPYEDNSSPYAPVNQSDRIGTVKYLNQGADFVIKNRREDAYKQMYQACKGKYKIVSEGPNSSGSTVVTNMGNNTWVGSSSEYWYINFKCVRE